MHSANASGRDYPVTNGNVFPRGWRSLVAVLLMLAVAWFGALGARKLTAPDEGRYAEIAREMAVSGDWVTPRYNDLKYFEKPPLQYWATALAFRVFGPSEWSARLWTALTGFAGVVLAAFTTARLVNPTAGYATGVVLAATPLWLVGSRVSSLDMGVSFFLQLAFSAFLLAFRQGLSPRAKSAWIHAAWAAMALAVLSKGLIGIVLPALVLAAYVAMTREWRLLRQLAPVSGFATFLAVAAPWFVIVSVRNPEFPSFFFLHEHFDRFVEGNGRLGPWWFFLVLLPVGILPWLLALPWAQHRWAPSGSKPSAVRVRTALVLWAVVIFVFFTLSQSKLPGYILPAVPPMAMLAGIGLAAAGRRALREITPFTGFTGAVIVAAGLILVYQASNGSSQAAYGTYGVWIAIGGLLWIVGAAMAWRLLPDASNTSNLRCLIALALGIHVGTQVLILGHDAVRANRSAFDIAQVVAPHLDRTQPFYAVRTFDHTLPFYLGKTLTLVDYEDELALGLQMEPSRGIESVEAFLRRWEQDTRPLALISPDLYESLADMGVPMQLVARDRRRVVVAKP